jgi:phosphoserine phosphatase RsbU/P
MRLSLASSWQRIIQLGDELLATDSLAAQRDLIVRTVSDLLDCQTELWLDENRFRLPGMHQTVLFAKQPPTDVIRKVVESGETCCPSSEMTDTAAVPLINHGVVIGALQVRRPNGQEFRKTDFEFLESLVGHLVLAMYASRRIRVEQWRIEQLTLVRRVSAQIANVTDINMLSHRVVELIQKAFRYYYVGLFTCEPGEEQLRFRSGARPARGMKKKQVKTSALRVKLGQGLVGLAAQTGEEVLSDDVMNDPRYRYEDSLPETRSEVDLPLKIEDRVLGVLDIQSDQVKAFHPNDLLVLRALADSVAVAVAGTRMYGELEKRARQLELVAKVSDEITSFLDLDELLAKVAVLIQERLKFPYVHLFTVHQNRRQIIYEAGSGARSQRYEMGYALDLDNDEGIIPWVARNGEAVLANDVAQEPRYRPSPLPPEDTRAELTVPLIYDHQVIGILDLQSDRKNAFDEDDRFLSNALADTIAVAIHNADLYRTERWRRQITEGLKEVAGLLSAEAGLEDVLEAILKELERNLPCDVSAIWLKEGDELYLAKIHGADVIDVEEASRNWPEAMLYLTDTLQAIEPVIRRPTDPIGPAGAACGFSADYSSVAVALRVGEQPVGVLTLSHHTSGRYGHEAQALTATFASHAAVAIENARLYDSAQEQAYASAALLQVAQAVATSNSMGEVLASITRIIPILVGVEACGVYLWDGKKFHPEQVYGFPENVAPLVAGSDFLPGDFPLLDQLREQGQPVFGLLNPDTPEAWLNPDLPQTQEDALYMLETGERLLLAFPLMIKGDLYGAMLIDETAEARRFRSKRIEILTSIAQEVALSIQNEHLQTEMVARERLEHEIQLARQIQRTFLPEFLPEVPGWDLSATWKTARDVGGDFYDVVELPGNRLGLFIADVSDKGIPAALFMALTRTLVRAVVYDTSSPAEALRRVNALIIPDNRQGMFVTAVYAVLSLESGELTYANAGHNPPLWLKRSNGKLETLTRTGMALGVVEDTGMSEKSICLDRGDSLLLYTDGVTEAFSPVNEFFGIERLSVNMAENPDADTETLLGSIEKSVLEFIGSAPLADDMTMLGIKRSK